MTTDEVRQRIEALTREAQARLAQQREQFDQRLEEQVAEIRRQHATQSKG